jgi:hypothetical protein
MAFRIEWSLADDEWERAAATYHAEPAGGLYDGSRGALYHLLWGSVQFVHNDERLFPRHLMRAFVDLDTYAPCDEDELADRTIGAHGDGVRISLVDLGYKFLHSITRHRVRELSIGSSVEFTQEAGDLVIYFTRTGESIEISSNRFIDIGVYPEDHRLLVDDDEFFRGVDEFVGAIARSLDRFVPGLLQWETFKRFRDYLGVADDTI